MCQWQDYRVTSDTEGFSERRAILRSDRPLVEMPPRYVYWTILIDGTPTAFRAASRDELLPTLKQLQRKTPGAVMKWFARGRVWESPEEARAAYRADAARRRTPRTSWRPGGYTRPGSDRRRRTGRPAAKKPRR